jgi:hypothetical protein
MNTRADIDDVLAGVEDFVLAMWSTCTVLITAAADDAVGVAMRIAEHCGAGERIRVCDARDGNPWVPAETADTHERPAVLLVREVHALTPPQQASLLQVLEGADQRARTPRIIASSSVSLFKRVEQGLFDERLFYHLNILHLVVPSPEAGWS